MHKTTKNQLCQPGFIALSLCLPGLFIKELFILSWMGLFPLLITVWRQETPLLYAARQTTLFGIFYFGCALTWLWSFSPAYYFAYLLMASFIWTFYIVLLFGCWRITSNTLMRILLGGITWLGYYALFYHSSFGTFIIETLFWAPSTLMQHRELTNGMHLWGAALMMFNISLAAWWLHKKSWINNISVAITFVMVVGLCGWSMHQSTTATNTLPLNNVALIQHNLPIDERRFNDDALIWETYQRLGLKAVSQGAELIVFPLYSIEADTYRESYHIQSLVDAWQTPVLMGMHVPEQAGGSAFNLAPYYAAALYFTPGATHPQIYRAVHKAPLNNRYESTVDDYVVLNTPLGKLGVLLCFEDAIPLVAKQARDAGADVLIALNNPSHFMGTELLDYHIQQDQFRAIENRLWLLRLSPNGYSAVINPRGKVIKKSKLNEEEIVWIKN